MIHLCIAGITGWVGSSLVPGSLAADDLELTGGVSRTAGGTPLRGRFPDVESDLEISGTVDEALGAGRTSAVRSRSRAASVGTSGCGSGSTGCWTSGCGARWGRRGAGDGKGTAKDEG